MFQAVFKRLHDAASLAKYYHDANSTFRQREIGDKILLRNHLVPSYANRKFVAKFYAGYQGLPFVVTKVVNNLHLVVKDQITGEEIKVHAANTRLLPGGPIHPLPTPRLTEKDCPFAFKDTRKGVVKRSKKNMYFKKSAKTSADNPFLSSDENDESTNEEEYDADDICDELCNDDDCRNPTGALIQWVQCNFCQNWYHLVCIDKTKEEIDSEEEYICTKCNRPQ